MNITLSQKEIETAVQQFVAGQGIAVTGKQMSVKFTMTRNPSGISAEIILEDVNATQIPGFTDRPAGGDTGLQLVTGAAGLETKTYEDKTVASGTAPLPETSPTTIGAAIANVIGTTAKDVDDLVTDGNSGDTTTDVAAEAVKSVPEDTAAVVDAGAAPAPAAATTNSLFGS